ncbi:MAG TPA: SLC13 family permease [Lachnospiraceae bacterium]
MDSKKRLLYLVLGPLMFVIVTLLLKESLGLGGAQAVGTLFWTVFWWATRPIHMTVTAFIPVIVNAIFNIVGMETVIAPYASSSVILIFGSGLLSLAWSETGLDKRVALRILSLIGPSIKSQILVWMLASVIMSTVMPNVAVVALLTPIAVAMLVAAGYKEIKTCAAAAPILLCIGWGAGIGGAGTPLGGAMNVTAISFIQEYTGKEFMYVDWLTRMLPYLVVVTVVMVVLMIKSFQKVENIEGTKAYFKESYAALGEMKRDEKISGILFVIAVVLAFSRPLYAKFVPVLEPAYVFLIFGSLAFMITASNKKPLLTWETAQEKSLWGMMLLFGGGISLGKLINESGAALGIAEQVAKLNLDGGFVTVIVFAIATVILSELTNSTVSSAVMIPIVISITSKIGLNPIPYCFIAILGYNAEFLLPISVRAIPISYGLDAGIMMKKGMIFVIVRMLVAILFGYLYLKFWPGFGVLSNM